MHNKNESLSADLKPGQGVLGPGESGLTARTVWDVQGSFTVKCQALAIAPPAGDMMLAGNCIRNPEQKITVYS
jgi:hypothetical protein